MHSHFVAHHSGWAAAYPNADKYNLGIDLSPVFFTLWVSKVLLRDQGPEFVSNKSIDNLKLLGI